MTRHDNVDGRGGGGGGGPTPSSKPYLIFMSDISIRMCLCNRSGAEGGVGPAKSKEELDGDDQTLWKTRFNCFAAETVGSEVCRREHV